MLHMVKMIFLFTALKIKLRDLSFQLKMVAGCVLFQKKKEVTGFLIFNQNKLIFLQCWRIVFGKRIWPRFCMGYRLDK